VLRIVLRDLVEHLFAQSGDWLVYKKVYLPGSQKPLYIVAYRTAGYKPAGDVAYRHGGRGFRDGFANP